MKPFNNAVFRSLRNFNYRLWAAGAFVSNIGTWMQRTAQDWLVFVILTPHNGSVLGTVMALQFAPHFIFLPWTGIAADRFNQRKLLMFTQGAMGGLGIMLGLMTVGGIIQLWHLYVFAFLFGSITAVDAPVRQTFVSELVGESDLSNAVALNSMSFNAGRFIGPAVSGVLIASAGTGWCFLINGFSFLGILASLFFLRKAELNLSGRASRRRGAFTEGLSYVRGRPDLIAILLMLFFIGTFGLNFPIFLSSMGIRIFHADAARYGFLSSVIATGTLAGALLNAGYDRIKFRHLVVSAGVFACGCAAAALSPDYWFFAASLIVTGIAAMFFTNATNSLMQLSTTPVMRGRVMALRVAVAMGTTPIGAPVTGWVADNIGPRWAMGIAALSGLAAAVAGLIVSSLNRKQDKYQDDI